MQLQDHIKKFLYSLYILLLTFFIWEKTSAQTGEIFPTLAKAPDVSTINKFIDCPVDMGTGVPSISIPIYNIEQKSVSVPVSISYHAGGIKVEEVAPSIGLGWALNVGGVISRSVRDYPDELGTNYGFYVNHGSLVKHWHLCSIINPNPSTTFQNVVPAEYEPLTFDKQPDLFSFSFAGYSGRFLFDENQKAHLIPEQDLKIDGGGNLSTITITTPDGTKYIFGTRDFSQSHSVHVTQDESATAWHLDKIIGVDNHEVNFLYVSADYEDEAIEPGQYHVRNCTDLVPEVNIMLNTYKTKLISKISSDICEIDFNYKTSLREDIKSQINTHALDNIEIKSKLDNSLIKKFTFSTSYFVSSLASFYASTWLYHQSIDAYLGKRLRLDAVAECDANGNCLPPYTFTYNKHNPSNTLPYRISTGQDHWGFYNGHNENITMVPKSSSATTITPLTPCNNMLADREGSAAYKSAFMLDEITFPTGGVTSYMFENINSEQYNIASIGGLRIKGIINYPGNGQKPIIKHYEYTSPYLTGGLPVYAQNILPNLYCEGPSCNQSPSAVCCLSTLTISSNPVNFYGEISSNYVIHEKVIERQEGNGLRECHFDVEHLEDESLYDDLGIIPLVATRPILFSGKLLQEVIKTEGGDIIKQTDYTYNGYMRYAIPQTQEWKTYVRGCDPTLIGFYQGTGAVRLVQKDEYMDGVHQVSQYEYAGIPAIPSFDNTDDFYHFVTKETRSTSDGSQIVTRYKYPINFKNDIAGNTPNNAWDNASEGIKLLLEKGILNSPIEKTTSRIKSNIEKIISSELTVFKNQYDAVANKSVLAPEKIYRLNIAAPLLYTSNFQSSISKSGNTYQFNQNINYSSENDFQSYDNDYNLLQSKAKNGIISSYVWGYNNNYMISKVDNALKSDIFYTSFEDETGTDISTTDSKTGSKSKLNGFTKNISGLSNGMYQLSYWYKSGSDWVLSTSDITVSGGTYAISLSGQIDDIRFYPKKGMLASQTYKPLIGLLDASDVNNKIIYYEYDGFNRLHAVRDFNKNILKVVDYHYTATPALSSTIYHSQGLLKSITGSCSSGYSSNQIIYVVPYGKYFALSQSDADLKAQADLNGQTSASYPPSFFTCYPTTYSTLYVRLEKDYESNPVVGSTGIDTYKSADLVLRFYSNSACTDRVVLNSSVVFGYTIQHYSNSTLLTTETNSVTGNAGMHQIDLGFQMLQFCTVNGCKSDTYIISSGGTNYTVVL